MATATKIKSAPLQITLREAQPSEVISAESASKTVSFIACEETTFERFDWFKGRYLLILSHDPAHVRLDRVNAGSCMFLEDHDSFNAASRIGKVLSATIEDKKLKVEVRLNSLEAGQRFYQEVLDRTEPPKSVGAAVYETEVVEAALYEEDEDGYKKQIRPATLRAIDWELMEVSSVSVPAIGSAATKEMHNEQQYEMLMHGDPGMSFSELEADKQKLDQTIREAVKSELSRAANLSQPSSPPTKKDPKKPTNKPPKTKPMATPFNRESLSAMDAGEVIDIAIDLQRANATLKTEAEELNSQLAQLHRKDKIRDAYFTLRNKAEGLLRQAKLSANDFAQDFSDSAIADINTLCKKDDAEMELRAIEKYLSRLESAAPLLNTEIATDKEPLPERKTEEKLATPTGKPIDEYTDNLLSRLFK